MRAESRQNRAKYLSSVIDAMSDMVRVIGANGEVVLENTAFKTVIGSGRGMECFRSLGFDKRCADCVSRRAWEEKCALSSMRKLNGRVYSVTSSPLISEAGEVSAVIESFRDMTEDYTARRALMRSNLKMQRDLSLAGRLQRSLVRGDFSDIAGIKISAGFFPCEAVGGDTYDCVCAGNNILAYVCDVSGHGVMPAMMAVFVSRVLREVTESGVLSPKEALYRLNAKFGALDVDDSIYITAFAVRADLDAEKLTYASAGLSVSPVLFDGKSTRELYMPSNPVSKWFDDPVFTEETVDFKAGSRLLMYTDGFSKLHTKENIEEHLAQRFSAADYSAEGFIAEMEENAGEKQTDDLTVLILDKKL